MILPINIQSNSMENRVYLDGILVYVEKINPKEHRFLGMFRPAQQSQLCPICGLLQTTLQVHNCYTNGHFDIPQYQTIK